MSIENELATLIGDTPKGLEEDVALGTGMADGYNTYRTPIGDVVVAFNLEGVSSVDLADDAFTARFEQRHGRPLIRAEAPAAWRRYIPDALEAGTPGRVPIDLRPLTDFQQKVLQAAATIPKGEVRPYAWLARTVSRPNAVRAAGSVMARNPVPLIVPCHRVVRSDGHLGKYSLGGVHNKHDLLEHEGASPDWLEQLAARHIRVRGNNSTGIYCHPTCHAIRRSKSENVVDFRSADEATDAGFRPCQLCRP